MIFRELKAGDKLYKVYADLDREPIVGIDEIIIISVEKYKSGINITYRRVNGEYCINSFFVTRKDSYGWKSTRFYLFKYDARIGLGYKCYALRHKIENIIKDNI